MNPSNLPENILSKMRPSDRKAMGQQTVEEAMASFEARNEKQLQDLITQYLRLKNIWHTKSTFGIRTTNTVGTPDLMFPYFGKMVCWEVKHGKGKLQKEQERVRDLIISQGGEWRLITSLGQAITHLHELSPNPTRVE